MAPIHESDLASERWAKAEWRNFELWEKVEVGLRRRKWMWIVLTAVIFLSLSAVPVVWDQRPKWQARWALRQLALELDQIKRIAATEHFAIQLRFIDLKTLEYVVEKKSACTDESQPSASVLKKAHLIESPVAPLTLVESTAPEPFGLPGLLTSICYDPVLGSNAVLADFNTGVITEQLFGFEIAPTADIASGRSDRFKILLVNGTTIETHLD